MAEAVKQPPSPFDEDTCRLYLEAVTICPGREIPNGPKWVAKANVRKRGPNKGSSLLFVPGENGESDQLHRIKFVGSSIDYMGRIESHPTDKQQAARVQGIYDAFTKCINERRHQERLDEADRLIASSKDQVNNTHSIANGSIWPDVIAEAGKLAGPAGKMKGLHRGLHDKTPHEVAEILPQLQELSAKIKTIYQRVKGLDFQWQQKEKANRKSTSGKPTSKGKVNLSDLPTGPSKRK